MSSTQSLIDGFLVMVVGIIFSILLMATIGQMGDRFLTTMIDSVGVTELNAGWEEPFNAVYTMQSILFIICVLPGIYGVVVFILAAVRRQEYDTFQEPQIDYTQQYREF